MPKLESRSEAILRAHQRVLDAIASRASLTEVLEQLTMQAEQVVPGLRCSVQLCKNGALSNGAAPSLPAEYVAAVDGLEIGPEVGSCGAAAFHGRRVIVSDTRTHRNWQGFLSWVERVGFRACWSEPIFSPSGDVVGTFAMYYREVREPQDFELDLIRTLAQIAGIAIQSAHLEHERELGELRLRKILDLDPNMLFVKDWDGRLLLANEALGRAYGASAGEILGRRHQELHRDGEELAKMLSDDRAVMMSGEPRFIPEETFVDANGHKRVLQTTKIPYEFAGEGVRAVLGVAVDITEHKRVEEWLRESEERFRQLAEAIREVFWLTDWSTHEVLYVSPAYETIWGQACVELYENAKSWSGPVHEEDRERVIEAFQRDAPRGEYDVEYRIRRPDGEVRWIHDRAFPILGPEGHVYRIAGLSEDVTRRKATELDLERALHELEERSRARLRSLESDLLWAEERERRRLAVDLHDGLNQILTLSQMKLGALEGAVEGPAKELASEIAGLLDQANRSARSLTFQLSPPILFDLGFEAALQWLAEDIQQSYSLVVELEGDLEPRTPPAPIEERIRVLLFRAVRELLINVAKHAGTHHARVLFERSAEDVQISVSDEGRAFDPAEVGRHGLGLSSIRERLESFGGRVDVQSVPGRGTTIAVRAPLEIEATITDPLDCPSPETPS